MTASASIPKPIRRSRLRLIAGISYYRLRRYWQWLRMDSHVSRVRRLEPLAHVVFAHRTPLLRNLQDVEMWLQHNKVMNLKIASGRIHGVCLRPGETFSYWRTIGKPTRRKGYVPGMLLQHGKVKVGIGGGLCQLSNLIYWMTLHTPLVVTERYRHSYDVFPDAGRTQPFGSGATCFYNYIDLQIKNPTQSTYQLCLYMTGDELVGEWRSDSPSPYTYEIIEKRHWFTQELWGGYIRHNELYRNRYDLQGQLLGEEFIAENHALMMYEPCLPEKTLGNRER
ncbi:VanW family protein [Paenibacillus puerhi]|uniref:VanW family protein n=1 Tax=Paenibacillus puerhi TaxID=2692622 RepID=UPI00135AC03A|nr:VanW family protein [Paenibacillus puerhi]